MQYETPQPRLYGGKFEYVDAATARLIVTDAGGFYRIRVGNGTSFRYVASSATKTMALTTAGAGGLHNTYAEQVSTVYTIYAAWRSATAVDDGDLVLFSVPSGTAVDAVLVNALTGGAGVYDYWSDAIGFVVNSAAGNVLTFYNHAPGSFWMQVTVLADGKATAQTAIPLTAFVPDIEGIQVTLQVKAGQGSATPLYILVFSVIGATTYSVSTIQSIGNYSGGNGYKNNELTVAVDNPATALQYQCSIAPTTYGLTVSIAKVQIEGY